MAWLVLAGFLTIGLTLSLIGGVDARERPVRAHGRGRVSNLLFGALAGVLLKKEEERATMHAPPVEPDRS